MKVFLCFLVFGATLVRGAPYTTVFSGVSPNSFAPDAVQISRYIGPSNYPGYYIYNYLQIDQNRGLPVAINGDGRPSLQTGYTYFGTPVYDYRYHFNQVIPGFPGFQPPSIPSQPPSFVPAQRPTYQPTTQRPFDDADGIEKLDEKLDPSQEANGNVDSHREDVEDDDTVTVEAI